MGLSLLPFDLSAQVLTDSITQKIDQLFDKYLRNDAPGCVAGIVKGKQLVYAKGFGLANLEDSIPNSPESIYYMCSLSKQFTGYAIALLIRAGKLNPDDPIDRYFPSMARLTKKITIRHLLYHTSGIRDDINMAAITGLDGQGMLTQQLAMNLLNRQQTLNFEPGEKFSYSNSNYVLLAEIVKQISGQRFQSFTDSAIFKPLGMTKTRFVSDPQELIKGRAASYTPDKATSDKASFKNAYQNVYTLGDGGLFTNMQDMAKWVSNFYSPIAGDLKDIELLTQPGKLNDNQPITYAFGIAVDTYKGHKRFLHNGGLAGYRTVIAIYPELQLGLIVFGNTGEGEIYSKMDQMAEVLITDKTLIGKISSTPEPIPFAGVLDTALIKKWIGNYISLNGYQLSISLKEGQLYVNKSLLLSPEKNNIFYLAQRHAVKYMFSSDTLFLASPALTKPMVLIHIPEKLISEKKQLTYVGTYYSKELDCRFQIVQKEKELWMRNNKHSDARITFMGSEHLFTDYDFLKHLIIRRDKRKKVIGFELNSGEMMHLYFQKVE